MTEGKKLGKLLDCTGCGRDREEAGAEVHHRRCPAAPSPNFLAPTYSAFPEKRGFGLSGSRCGREKGREACQGARNRESVHGAGGGVAKDVGERDTRS